MTYIMKATQVHEVMQGNLQSFRKVSENMQNIFHWYQEKQEIYKRPKEAKLAIVKMIDDLDMASEEVELDEASYDDDLDAKDMHLNFVTDTMAKIDEIDMKIDTRSNISTTRLKKAKP